MKNKTSGCTLQVINHLITIKKKNNQGTYCWDNGHVKATSPVMRYVVGGCGVISAYSPNLLFFCLLFLKDRGRQSFHELSGEHLLWRLPGWDPFMLPVLTWLRHTYPDSRNLGMGRHSPGTGSCGGRGYRSPCPRAGCNLWAPLQPRSHPWGVPHRQHKGWWHWVSAGLKFDAPSLMFFARRAFDRDYRLPSIC